MRDNERIMYKFGPDLCIIRSGGGEDIVRKISSCPPPSPPRASFSRLATPETRSSTFISSAVRGYPSRGVLRDGYNGGRSGVFPVKIKGQAEKEDERRRRRSANGEFTHVYPEEEEEEQR